MKAITLYMLLLLTMVTAQQQTPPTPLFTICGTISNYEPGKSIYIALYTSNEDFKARKFYKKLRILKNKLPSDSVDYCFEDIEAGEYMVVCFQDIDDNGELKFGLFGRPTEPYCIFRHYKGIFRPAFNDCKFKLDRSKYDADLLFEEK